jgi:hypothetical protein
MQQLGYNNGVGRFLCGPRRDVRDKNQLRNQFFAEGCEERTSACEAKNSPLLEVVARERLETAGWKMLRECCDDFYIVEISDGPVTACSSESCV